MADREKVIKGLECCRIDETRHVHCADCPYYTDDDEGQMWCSNEINNDAIELLKEQEAMKPISKSRHGANPQIQHFCGNCNAMLHGKPKFCSSCGRGVKWE